MSDLIKKAREKLAFDSESFDVEVEGLNERGEVIITLDEEMVELMKYGMTAEHARTAPIIDALLKVADHAIHTELCSVAMENGVECTCGLDDVLRELSQAVEGDPAQKGG